MRFEMASREDLETVTTQLGREPKNVVGIAARCPLGHPSVVANYPIQRRGKRIIPFPTLFWLTCPQLSKSLSTLEMRGLIDEIDERLGRDERFAECLESDHRAYREERVGLLSTEDLAAIDAAGLGDAMRTGIGGQRNWRSVKCLHLHFAHHLVRSNTIGALLAAEYGIAPCAR